MTFQTFTELQPQHLPDLLGNCIQMDILYVSGSVPAHYLWRPCMPVRAVCPGFGLLTSRLSLSSGEVMLTLLPATLCNLGPLRVTAATEGFPTLVTTW